MDGETYMRVFEKTMVRNCAPTIAGIKPANLFLCQEKLCGGAGCIAESETGSGRDAAEECCPSPSGDVEGSSPHERHCKLIGHALRECRSRFEPMGLNVEPFAKRRNGTLVYVYRPDRLRAILDDARCAEFLCSQGYEPESMKGCLRTLRYRMRKKNINGSDDGTCNFPHEIGVFLGYPIDDVIGFVENKGANYIVSGYWKVYSNPEEAIERFDSYKACKKQLVYRYEVGESLEDLIA